MPFELSESAVRLPGASKGWVQAQVVEGKGQVRVLGEDGQVVAEVLGIRGRKAETSAFLRQGGQEEKTYWVEWRREEGKGGSGQLGEERKGSWAVLEGTASELGKGLAEQLEKGGAKCVVAVGREAGLRLLSEKAPLAGVVCLFGGESQASVAEVAEANAVWGLEVAKGLVGREGSLSFGG